MVAMVRRVVDWHGAYEVAADSLMATAPRRRDGGWDRRTKLGRAAFSEFLGNQYDRGEEQRLGKPNWPRR
jgi:hypothetical protein